MIPLSAMLVAINAVAFALFAHDKRAARTGRRRVPEASLLCWALIGGSPAILTGRHFLRHKTRKQPFAKRLFMIVAIQAAALVAVGAVSAGWL